MRRLTFVLMLFIQTVFSQENNVSNILLKKFDTFSNNLPQESIYLQTSKDIYETEEDVWFKAYVLDSKFLTPSNRSKILFVQLIENKTNTLVWEEKYEIENGFVNGHLYLQDSLKLGGYDLIGYTAHSVYENTKRLTSSKQLKIVKNITEKNNVLDATVVKQDSILDFRMFPEGGHLISGIPSTLAFKAVNAKGMPVDVSGSLLENNKPLLEFTSEHAGMGQFVFTPDASKQYTVKLSDSLKNKTYPIPEIKPKGMSLQLVQRNDEFLLFNVFQNIDSLKKNIYLRLQVRGEVYSLATASFKREVKIKVLLEDIPSGIAEVTLFNENFEPVCERLVYVKSNQRLHIKAIINKSEYQTREKGTLKLKVTDEQGNPVVAHLGVSIFDKIYSNPKKAKNILTHFHLTNQLKGSLYNPSYYFNTKNENRLKALDLLLLTQGWRRYLWSETNLKALKTPKQMLFDDIEGLVKFPKKYKKRPLKALPALMAFTPENDDAKNIDDFIFMDSTGKFTITPKHLELGRLVYVKLLASEKPKYRFNVEDKAFNIINEITSSIAVNYPLPRETKAEIKESILPFRYPSDVRQLDEVILKTKRKKIYRDKYIGKLDSIINLSINNDYVGTCGTLNCFVHGRKGITRPVHGETYNVLLGKNGEHLGEHYNESTYYGTGTVTYRITNHSEAFLLEKFNLRRVNGYYGKREFYQPIYNEETVKDPFLDYRNTLYWKPDIITDKNGEAEIDFFCSDINSKFIGRIEGIDSNGFLGEHTFKFRVKKEL